MVVVMPQCERQNRNGGAQYTGGAIRRVQVIDHVED